MMVQHYAFPKLSRVDLHWFRLLGPGLGNLLFPWARSEVAAEEAGLQRLRPTWPQLKMGPWVRREPDKRGYSRLFAADPLSLDGVRRLHVLASHRHVDEDEWFHGSHGDDRPRVVVFSGVRQYFVPLLGHEGMLLRRLQTLDRAHRAPIGLGPEAIAMHVRLGDFRTMDPAANTVENNHRVPLRWYRQAIGRVREDVGDKPVLVYSDGSDSELEPLLAIEGVQRARQGNALQDILAMASSAALIASVSTFSGWASFLGGMPTYWPRRSAVRGLHRQGVDVSLPATTIR